MSGCQSVIDWAATGSMLQGIGTLTGAGAVLIAAGIGANTFKRWKQQKVAERRAHQAERIMTATYKARRRLSQVRGPMMWAHETDAAQKQLEESGQLKEYVSEQDKRNIAYLQAYYNRLTVSKPEQDDLESCQPMARALFSEKLEKAIETLNAQFWSVKVHADAYCQDRGGADTAFKRKIESTIWEGFPSKEENEVDQIVNKTVKQIEAVCLPALRLELSKNPA